MKKMLSKFFAFLALALLAACASTPQAPVYSDDPYNPEFAEAFTLNYFLKFKRSETKGMDFDVEVFHRASGKEAEIHEREIVVFWMHEGNRQKVEKKSKNSFSFAMKQSADCWKGVYGVLIEDPRPALQKATVNLSTLCEEGLK